MTPETSLVNSGAQKRTPSGRARPFPGGVLINFPKEEYRSDSFLELFRLDFSMHAAGTVAMLQTRLVPRQLAHHLPVSLWCTG
jgi:hypothetical protein